MSAQSYGIIHKAEHLNITPHECIRHDRLMSQVMTLWPRALQAFVEKEVRAVGLCGDVIDVSVANWIRETRQ